MRSDSDYALSMPKVAPDANPGMLNAVLAYHADDEIARAVVKGEVVIGVVLVLIGLALLWRLQGAPTGGRNQWARAAAILAGIGIAAYVVSRIIPSGDEDDPSDVVIGLALAIFLLEWLIGIVGPVLAIQGLGRVRYDGEPRLAAAAFVASLVLPAIFIANVYACAVTDACFH